MNWFNLILRPFEWKDVCKGELLHFELVFFPNFPFQDRDYKHSHLIEEFVQSNLQFDPPISSFFLFFHEEWTFFMLMLTFLQIFFYFFFSSIHLQNFSLSKQTNSQNFTINRELKYF